MSTAAEQPHDFPEIVDRFRHVYVCLDGSPLSDRSAEIAIEVAQAFEAALTGGHAYAARLHDNRFKQMEGGLPENFQEEEELNRQRKVHDTLITRGLELISDSYLDVAERKAEDAGLALRRSVIEGRNWRVLLGDIVAENPDVVVLGAVGLGAVDGIHVGSVCERVVRRLDSDALVVRNLDQAPFSRVGVALDGSAESLGALASAIAMVKESGGRIELLSSFDPHFHHHAFRAIKDVLSSQASKVFKFEDQQQLHEEIIDSGLARIYKGHLEVAGKLVAEAGIADAGRTLLSGKAHVCVRRFAAEKNLTTLFMGRTGIHSRGDLDLGACTETLLRSETACNLFVSARKISPDRFIRHEEPLTWTVEARERMSAVPGFVQGMATGAVERRARELGHTVVTSELITETMASARMGKMHALPTPSADRWTAEASARLARVPEGVMRDMTRQAVEKWADENGEAQITEDVVEAKYASWQEGGSEISRELEWTDAALTRVQQRVPDIVRNSVIKEVEQRCRRRGIEVVNEEVLAEFREQLGQNGGFHS